MNLVFINFYQAYSNRGGETYVHEIAERLSNLNNVTVLQAGHNNNNNKYHTEEIKINFDPNHFHSRLPVTHILKRLFIDYFHLKELLFSIKLLPKLSALKPDYVFPQNSGWEVLLTKLFCIFSGSKMIIAGQSGPGWNDRINLLVRPNVFIALTSSQASWAKRASLWKKQKIIIIPNGVDPVKFTPIGKKYKTSLTHPIVLAVGAATKSKRITSTIMAVAKLKEVSLLVVGAGPYEKEENELAEKLLVGRYKRIKISHQEMPAIYRCADVFTLCSDHSEAFGIVYLEALSTGLPIVATDDQSRREIVGDNGFFVVNPQNANEYSNKILQALKKGKGLHADKQVIKFSWDNIARQYQDLLINGK